MNLLIIGQHVKIVLYENEGSLLQNVFFIYIGPKLIKNWEN